MASSASRGNSKSPPSNLKVSERPLTLIKTIGEKGSGDGQFDNPTSLAVTAEGDIVVADRNNSRLQFLSKDGSFKKKVDLEFQPWCVAVMPEDDYYPKKLLVTGDGPMIHALDEQGMKSGVIQVTGIDVEADETTEGIAVGRSGYIIVTIGNKVFIRDAIRASSYTFRLWSKGQFGSSSSLRVAVNKSDQLIVIDLDDNNMNIFDLNRCDHVFTCGSFGHGPGELHKPRSIITDGEDNIIVADCGNSRVSVFSRDGTFIRHVLTKKENGLKYPLGLATHDGYLVVSGNDYVKLFKI